MIVIGIDPGTAITGFGLIEETDSGELKVIQYGVIQTSSKIDLSSRLLELHNQLKDLLLLYKPDTGAVEKLFFQKNVRTALAVGHARGVAMLAMAEIGLKVAEYTPLQIKQAVVGYGRAEKSQVQQMVRVILNLPEIPKPDDAADALAVAVCQIHSTKITNI